MRHWFDKPVSIIQGSVIRRVTSVEEAGRLLLEGAVPGNADKAKRAVIAALNGGSIDKAAAAFEEAARDAGVLVD